MRPHRRRTGVTRGRAALALLGLLVAGGGCGTAPAAETRARPETPFRGAIVLITVSALSPQAIGGSASATPRLDAFIAEASWSGTGIASASWSVGSLASVFTGLPPSLHGAGHPGHPWLRPAVRTLAEELSAAGFATHGFYATPWLGPGFGMERGFTALRPLRRRAPERHLAGLADGPSLTWIQLPLPGPSPAPSPGPLAGAATPGPSRADGEGARLAPVRSRPRGPQRERVGQRAPRRQRIAEADRRLGRLLEALRSSGRWEDSIVIVHSDHGEAPEERPAPLPGTGIGRGSVEAPIAIRLPPAMAVRIRSPEDTPIGLDRLFASVLELAGVRPVPAAAPSLLRSGSWPAISELWFANGYHEVALYEDAHQLRWRCRFADPDPSFEEARIEALGGGSVRFGELVTALEAEFRARPECDGEEWVLESWMEPGGATPVEDAPRARRMLDRLRALRSFPPPWSVEAAPPRPLLRRREVRALAGWGLPVHPQWSAPP